MNTYETIITAVIHTKVQARSEVEARAVAMKTFTQHNPNVNNFRVVDVRKTKGDK